MADSERSLNSSYNTRLSNRTLFIHEKTVYLGEAWEINDFFLIKVTLLLSSFDRSPAAYYAF